MEERITNIEIQLMHQEKSIDQLNDVVVCQQQMIDKLALELKLMTEHVQAIAPSAVGDGEEEPPPHY